MSGRLWRLEVPGQPLRGAYVSLGQDWPALVTDRNYTADEAGLLGQALTAMPLLLQHLKRAARLSLQISQAGPLKLLAVQGSTEGAVRGLIKTLDGAVDPATLSGQLAVTLEPADSRQRFQGIVPLDGGGLAHWLTSYFERSEQIPTRLLLCANGQQAAGIMLQQLPGEEASADWIAAVDAIDVDLLPPEPGEWLSTMLGFDLRVDQSPRTTVISCQCSSASVGSMLHGLGRTEVEQLLQEQGQVEVECGFCGQKYAFDPTQVEALFSEGPPPKRPN